jgi:hypothetical protein
VTITVLRPVSSATMSDEPKILDRTAVGALIGMQPNTITIYLRESLPGGRFESNPFPAPDGRVGGAPWWLPSRADEIREWDADRPRGGMGGRPRSAG